MNEILKAAFKGKDLPKKDFINLLDFLSDAYYNKTAIINDAQFDYLKNLFEAKYPNDSYLNKIGAPSKSGFKKANHKIPMGSLKELHTGEELNSWVHNNANENVLCISEKIDGLSVSLEYRKGLLYQAITRGDGSEGEDITKNILKIRDLTKSLDTPLDATFRGEIALYKSRLQEHFPNYKNTRNGAQGIVQRHSGAGCEHLTIFFYKVICDQTFATEFDEFEYLSKTLKLLTPRYYKLNSQSCEVLRDKYEQYARDKLDYDIDGFVATINDKETQKRLASSLTHPEFSRKFKFIAEKAETELFDVSFQVGRTGKLTPLAHLYPVDLCGASIKKATLHNLDEIERLDIKINDTIEIIRSGDVIPKIVRKVRSNPDSTLIILPKRCPICVSELVKKDATLYCLNDFCGARKVKALRHWITTLGIKDFGDKLIEQLAEIGKLNTISDFYKLELSDITHLERQGIRSAEKALSALHNKRELTITEILAGMNIPQLSDSRAEIFESVFLNFDKILNLTHKDINSLDGFGEGLSEVILPELQKKKPLIEDLLNHVTLKKYSGKYIGKSFCFTGFRDNKAEEEIKNNGGKLSKGVTKSLTYLIVENLNSTTSKMKKASSYGIKILSREQLNKMLFNTLF